MVAKVRRKRLKNEILHHFKFKKVVPLIVNKIEQERGACREDDENGLGYVPSNGVVLLPG